MDCAQHDREAALDKCVTTLQQLEMHVTPTVYGIDTRKLADWYTSLQTNLVHDVTFMRAVLGYENFYKQFLTNNSNEGSFNRN
jgi:hypothetical protein